MTDPKYPIGKFTYGLVHSHPETREHVHQIRSFPYSLLQVTATLTPADLEKTYRPGGWTVKQLIHHIGESHMNFYVRLKLALTEDNPVIKPYNEDNWVHTHENDELGPEISVMLIEVLHVKIATLLDSMAPSDFDRTYVHPQYNRTFTIREMVALYAWHGKHHLEHIKLALGTTSPEP